MHNNTLALIKSIVENNPNAVFGKLQQLGLISHSNVGQKNFETYAQILNTHSHVAGDQAIRYIVESLSVAVNPYGANAGQLTQLPAQPFELVRIGLMEMNQNAQQQPSFSTQQETTDNAPKLGELLETIFSNEKHRNILAVVGAAFIAIIVGKILLNSLKLLFK